MPRPGSSNTTQGGFRLVINGVFLYGNGSCYRESGLMGLGSILCRLPGDPLCKLQLVPTSSDKFFHLVTTCMVPGELICCVKPGPLWSYPNDQDMRYPCSCVVQVYRCTQLLLKWYRLLY